MSAAPLLRSRPSVYLDSSALVKLVRAEAETKALFAELSRWKVRTSSALCRVELLRALRRVEAEDKDFERAEAVLERLVLIGMDEEILRRAGAFRDRHLRALDAIHLATAVSIRSDIGAVVVYDHLLREAAEREGLFVIAPGVRR